MRIGESKTIGREPIEVGRGDLGFRVVATNISVPQVVGQNQHDVRRCGENLADTGQEKKPGEKTFIKTKAGRPMAKAASAEAVQPRRLR